LLNYTFYINDGGSGADFTYQAIVTDWSGGLLGGAAHAGPSTILFASTDDTYVGNGTFEAITVNIPDGGLTLTPGDTYFMGLTTLTGADKIPPTGPGVPDSGSAMALMATALTGLCGIARRFRK
jgi:hypothetical protein